MSADALKKRRVSAFLVLAADELKLAHLAARQVPRGAMFQAQQAVEKLLRAVLEAEDRKAGTTHNIEGLSQLLGSDHTLYGPFLRFDTLSPAATIYRYPGSSGRLATAPPADEIIALLDDIEALQTQVLRFLRERNLISES